MAYFILYTVGMILFGFVFGFTLKSLQDRDIIHSLERQKASLHRQLTNRQKESLIRPNTDSQTVERIEIIDNRSEMAKLYDPF